MDAPSEMYRDLFDPGWREREAETHRKLLEAVPLRKKAPCGECHLRIGERCDICGARATTQEE